MLDYQSQYETHKLYNHFLSWIDMERTFQDNYYIINTALYAAESYILKNYNIILTPTVITQYFGSVNAESLIPSYHISNIASIYINDDYSLPSTSYFDTTTKKYIKTDGACVIGDDILYEATGENFTIEYISGYTYPEPFSYQHSIPEGNSILGQDVSMPKICNPNGSPLYSPLSTIETYYDLFIIGDEGSTIYVDGFIGELLDATGHTISEDINPREVINSDRIGRVSLWLALGVNEYVIKCVDAVGNESLPITVIINRQTSFNSFDVVVTNKDIVSNNGEFQFSIATDLGAAIKVDGVDIVLYSSGNEKLKKIGLVAGVNIVEVVVTNPSGSISNTLTLVVLNDTSLNDMYVKAINSVNKTSIEVPQDILMAVFMLANHYYRSALYKHDETSSYGDNVSNRVTFNADRFPKDAHKILSSYVVY